MSDMCFFDTARKNIIDGAVLQEDGTYKGQYGGHTLAEYGESVELWDMNEAWKVHQDSRLTEPVETTKEDFWYFLEVLFPCSWERHGTSESFHMSEHTTGNITLILVRIGERYFKYEGYANTGHNERVEKCLPLYKATEEFEK